MTDSTIIPKTEAQTQVNEASPDKNGFDLWFTENSYDRDFIEAFRLAWNAAVSACSDHVSSIEGTDFDVSAELHSEEEA